MTDYVPQELPQLSGSLAQRIMVVTDYAEEHGMDPLGSSDTTVELSNHLQRSWLSHPTWTAKDWLEDFWYWKNRKDNKRAK